MSEAAAANFLFGTCQIGAERALKAEMARLSPDFRPAFSRPGFVTFKLPSQHCLADDFDPHAVFARSHGLSLGKAKPTIESLRTMTDRLQFDEAHVYARGDRSSEAVPTTAALLAEAQGWPSPSLCEPAVALRVAPVASSESPSAIALDCVVVEPDELWLGYHRLADVVTSWPGGWFTQSLPEHAVSRAYLKMAEAIAWSQFPLEAGQHVAEIGCAPGGASQALLERGLVVTGIDPANVDEQVVAHPQFTHVRKRGHEVKRRDFRHTHWLTADMNLAPNYTLDTVEAIVTHHEVQICGLLITLKLLEWSLAEEIPAYLDRIRSWGYADVRARQLSHNRQ